MPRRTEFRVPELLKRLPLTIALLLLIIGLGWYANSHVGELDAWFHRRVGYSTRLLLEGEVHRIFSSLLFTAGGVKFYQSLLMLAMVVGWTEWHHGTRRTAILFFGFHTATVIIMSLLIAWPLANLGLEHGRILFSERDVGPSAGYYGCLGYCVALVTKPRARVLASSLIGLLLVIRLGYSIAMLDSTSGGAFSADLAHALAFPLGWMVGRMIVSKPPDTYHVK